MTVNCFLHTWIKLECVLLQTQCVVIYFV